MLGFVWGGGWGVPLFGRHISSVGATCQWVSVLMDQAENIQVMDNMFRVQDFLCKTTQLYGLTCIDLSRDKDLHTEERGHGSLPTCVCVCVCISYTFSTALAILSLRVISHVSTKNYLCYIFLSLAFWVMTVLRPGILNVGGDWVSLPLDSDFQRWGWVNYSNAVLTFIRPFESSADQTSRPVFEEEHLFPLLTVLK